MKVHIKPFLIALPLSMGFIGTASADPKYDLGSVLTGDVKLACEALLCLSTSTRPSECNPSIKRFFSIHHKKPHKTFQARLNFLKLCPKNNSGDIDKATLAKMGINETEQSENMEKLSNAIARLPYECEPSVLNRQIEKKCLARTDKGNCEERGYRIVPTMPKACKDLANHAWVRLDLPVYVGNYKWSSSYPTKRDWVTKSEVQQLKQK